jgi:hypothetical protein
MTGEEKQLTLAEVGKKKQPISESVIIGIAPIWQGSDRKGSFDLTCWSNYYINCSLEYQLINVAVDINYIGFRFPVVHNFPL